MKITAVSCILGIINTLAAYSRGVLHIECVMESVYASCIQQHPSLAFSRAFSSLSQMLKQRAEYSSKTAGRLSISGERYTHISQTIPPKVEQQ